MVGGWAATEDARAPPLPLSDPSSANHPLHWRFMMFVRVRHTRAVALLALALLGCSSSSSSGLSSSGGAVAPPGPLQCMGDSQQDLSCQCTAAATATGACSPQMLMAPAHCCASVVDGRTTQCNCEVDPGYCVATGDGRCICDSGGGADLGEMVVPECPKPAGTHCCQARGQAYCACGPEACSATQTEQDVCTGPNSVLTCLAPAVAVESCQ